jgi:predicted nucleotidyltransferase
MREIFSAFEPLEKAVLFGSRATGIEQPNSDIDLALWVKGSGGDTIPLIKDRLEEETSTSLKFDVVDMYRLTKTTLRESIEQQGVVIYERTQN